MSVKGRKTDFWFVIEAYEYLRDDPCLPLDPTGSGNDQILDKTSKDRIDRSLTGGGATSQKIVTFAWDPDFTCTTKLTNYTIASKIQQDYGKPIISDCFFHSVLNKSVVAIGYNLEAFVVNWPNFNNSRHISYTSGYYFDITYGLEDQRVPSVMYTQLYDPYDDGSDLAGKGWVRVQPEGGTYPCIFDYDFTNE